KALKLAEINAKNNKVKVKFAKHDLMSGIKGGFDVIIANLPYVPVSDYRKLYKNLKYEPKLALTDNSDNFHLIYNFLEEAPKSLNRGGRILIESDPKFFKKFKHTIIRIKQDIHKLDRFAEITL
ncbi:MAG TPA: hypothetical protein VHQ20_00180, partial [Patescibacteria group bacterium]|nr:hypothetical protein [Patescibacteria group bacterium]